jgi:hypothetical protein
MKSTEIIIKLILQHGYSKIKEAKPKQSATQHQAVARRSTTLPCRYNSKFKKTRGKADTAGTVLKTLTSLTETYFIAYN